MVVSIATYYHKHLQNSPQNTYRAIFQTNGLIKLGAKQFKCIPVPGTRTAKILNILSSNNTTYTWAT
jgi:hypothetical protein